jgi:hypothetical protein
MSKASKSVKERTLTDAQGREFPVKVLHTEIVEKDAAVKKAMDCAIKLQERIISDKQKLIQTIEKYLNDAARRNNLEWKGNALLISFDEKYRVEMRFREKIQFGIELQLAKQKIDECIKAWSADSNDNLKAIVSDAFQLDKHGQLARYRIFALRRFKIKDPVWKEAMELIDKVILVTSTKQYISFAVRDEAGNYNKIVLNFSAL